MITARHSHRATLIPDGAVLIAGGFSGWPQPTSRAEIYRPAVLVPPPALMSLSQDGRRQGAILHAGTARVAGFDVATHPHEVRKRLGLAMQTPSLDTFSTGRETLELAGRLQRMSSAEVKQALDELPERFRSVVVLDVEGFSYREIAEMLEIPIGTVMSRLHRARRSLQRRLYDLARERGIAAARAMPRPEGA